MNKTQRYNNRSTRKLVIAKWLQTSYLIGTIPITETQWGGAFQVTGMIEWGQKSKPKKILWVKKSPKKCNDEFPTHKNFQKATNDITISNLRIVLNTQKIPT